MRCLGIAQSQEDWYLRYLARSTHQPAVMMRSFGYMYKMRSFGYKPVGGGEGRGIGDYWSCCVVFHHINKPPRGKGRNLSAVHFTFSFYYRTFYFSHILLGCCFFSSNRSKAKSKHKHRSKSCYNVYMPSYVHQSQTQGIYTYITRCVTKRKTPTK